MKTKKTLIVKKDFEFFYKTTASPVLADAVLKHNKGDIIDVGCATCLLYKFLSKKGWKKHYYGIDIEKYKGYRYPKNKNLTLIINDAVKIKFPRVGTTVLFNILEHLDDNKALQLLKKSLKVSKNVLIGVPKRNEELWKHGVVEYHQLDKTHKHCGYTKEELNKLVRLAGGKIIKYEEYDAVSATLGLSMWKNQIPRKIMYLMSKIFPSKKYYFSIWCEVVLKK